MASTKARRMKAEDVSAVKAVESLDAGLRDFVGYNLKRSSEAIKSRLSRVLKQFDLKMVTYSALTVICENPGISQTQLADALSIERTRTVLVVDELEQRGLITRERVPSDRRAHSLMPTLAGRRLAEKARAADVKHEAALLAGLNTEELGRFLGILRLIEQRAAISPEPEDH